MANLTPIDRNTITEIANHIEFSKEQEEPHDHTLNIVTMLCNKLQDEEIQKQVLDICLQDSETANDQQCIEQLETFISTL